MLLGAIVSNALPLTFIVCIHFVLFSSPQYSCAESLERQIFIKIGGGEVTFLHAIAAVAAVIPCITAVYVPSRPVQIQAEDPAVLDEVTRQQNNSLCPQIRVRGIFW